MFAVQDEGDSTRRDPVEPFEEPDAADDQDEAADAYQADADAASVEEAGYGYGV